MVTLCSFPQNMLNPGQVEVYFDALRYTDERILLLAFKKICSAPPNKLTLAVILHQVNNLQPKVGISDWSGKECIDENCNRGLISEQIGVYGVLFRCLRCDSSRLKWINDYTPENIEREKQKHAPVERSEISTRIEDMTVKIG